MLSIADGIKELEPLIKQGKLIIFVGSGVSIPPPANLPTWDELIQRFIRFCEDIQSLLPTPISFNNLLDDARANSTKYPVRVATVLRDQLREIEKNGSGAISKKFQADFQKLFYSGKPNVLHKLIVSTNYPYILTTNYDTLLEEAAKEEGHLKLWNSVFNYQEAQKVASAIYEERASIIHLHGSAYDIALNEFVFTVEDYKKIKKKHPGFTVAIQSLFLRHCVLFVGYGGSDPHWEDFIDDLSDSFDWPAYPNYQLRHFLFLRKDKTGEVLEKYKKKVNTEIIGCDDYSTDTEKLLSELKKLATRP